MDGSGRRRRGALRRLAAVVAILAALYLALAYLLLPALWRHHESQPGLANLTMVTRTPQGIPGDPINVGLVGTRAEVVRAFLVAGWHPADPITLESSIAIGASVVFDRPDPDAPVSTLDFEGRRQDLAFERADGRSADKRHHVRLWLTLDKGVEGRPVWLGSASFDSGVGFSHDTGQITHHIGPDLDKERDALIGTLIDAGLVGTAYQVSGIGPTVGGRNGGGDAYFTDGEVTIAVLETDLAKKGDATTVRPNPPSASAIGWLWRNLVRPLLRP